MSNSIPFIFSKMTEADLAEVTLLEQQNPGPWNKKQLHDELAQPTGWQWLARDANNTICGYLIGRTVVDEAEILRLAVATNKRRQGVAQHLLIHTFSVLLENNVRFCFLELRASNIIAHALYEKNGFQASSIRKNYYREPCENAVVMTKLL